MPEPIAPTAAFVRVLRRELGNAWRGALAWLLPTMGLVVMTLSLQPEMAKQGSAFMQKLEMMPKELLIAFGVQMTDLFEPAHYMATNFTFVQLIGAVYAALLGGTIVAREEAYGTGELLYALPVARRTVVLAKVAAGLVMVVGFDVGLLIAAYAGFAAVDVAPARAAALPLLLAGTAALHVAVFGLGLLATVRAPRPRSATSLALGLIFGLYGIGVVGALSPSLGWLRWLSPFRHAEPIALVDASGLPAGSVALLAVAGLSVAVATALFERKDIHA